MLKDELETTIYQLDLRRFSHLVASSERYECYQILAGYLDWLADGTDNDNLSIDDRETAREFLTIVEKLEQSIALDLILVEQIYNICGDPGYLETILSMIPANTWIHITMFKNMLLQEISSQHIPFDFFTAPIQSNIYQPPPTILENKFL